MSLFLANNVMMGLSTLAAGTLVAGPVVAAEGSNPLVRSMPGSGGVPHEGLPAKKAAATEGSRRSFAPADPMRVAAGGRSGERVASLRRAGTAVTHEPAGPIVPMAVGLATLVAATPALADTGVSASLSVSAPLLYTIAVALLYGVPLTRALVRGIRGLTHRTLEAPTTRTDKALDIAEAPGATKPEEIPVREPAKPGLLERANRFLGRSDMRLSPFRDHPLFWGALALGSLALDPYRSLIGYLTPLSFGLATALSRYNPRYRLRTVDRTLTKRAGDTPDGLRPAAWDATRENAIGPLGYDVPKEFASTEFHHRNHHYYTDTPQTSAWPAAVALKRLGQYIFNVYRQLRDREGIGLHGQAIRFMWTGRAVSVNPRVALETTPLARQALLAHADAQRVNIEMAGQEVLDQIPVGAPMVWVGVHHDALWPNYYGPFFIRHHGHLLHIRPSADYDNYCSNPWLRFLAPIAPVVFAKIGLFFSRRNKGQGRDDGFDAVADAQEKIAAGLQPLVFPQAGRVPRAYREDGTLDEPGLYANVVSESRPHLFIKTGDSTDRAVELAVDRGEAVYVPILRSRGGYRIDPKRTRNVFKPIETRTDQTMRFEVVNYLKIDPVAKTDIETAKQRAATQLADLLRTVTDVDALIESRIQEWPDAPIDAAVKLSGRYGSLVGTDPDEALKYYIIADRIRSVPPRSILPNDHDRSLFQRRLLYLLNNPHAQAEVDGLLAAVNAKVKAVQYAEIDFGWPA